MPSSRLTASVLQELKGMGIRIAADDFDTGWSSLSYLREFPIAILKVNRSFINQITADCDGPHVLRICYGRVFEGSEAGVAIIETRLPARRLHQEGL
jgi:EAL domain-containing protein (putative c-di-GMP-specific phosphodiesterase class I)